jgi:hypothetical protein
VRQTQTGLCELRTPDLGEKTQRALFCLTSAFEQLVGLYPLFNFPLRAACAAKRVLAVNDRAVIENSMNVLDFEVIRFALPSA